MVWTGGLVPWKLVQVNVEVAFALPPAGGCRRLESVTVSVAGRLQHACGHPRSSTASFELAERLQ